MIKAFIGAPPGRRGARARDDEGRDPPPRGHPGRSARGGARVLRRRARLLHGLQAAQHPHPRDGREARPEDLRVRRLPREDGPPHRRRHRGGGLRGGRPAVDPAGAARGRRRDRGREGEAAAAPRSRSTTCGATCTATRTRPTVTTPSTRSWRPRRRAATRTSRSPTTAAPTRVAGGLSVDELRAHVRKIRAVAKRYPKIVVLAGSECDILPDGRLDYPDARARRAGHRRRRRAQPLQAVQARDDEADLRARSRTRTSTSSRIRRAGSSASASRTTSTSTPSCAPPRRTARRWR